MKPKHKRLLTITVFIAMIGAGIGLILQNLNDNLLYFFSPTQLIEKTEDIQNDKYFRLGGLVKKQSISKIDPLTHQFTITDQQNDVIVRYQGILPNLFREGQGIIAKGTYSNNTFFADTLLAKHDEKYMPPEVAKALKESGHFKE